MKLHNFLDKKNALMDALQSEDSAENPTTISSKNDDSFKSDLVFNQIKSEERVIEPISEIKRAPKNKS